jgi:hypothetical protein
MTFTNISYYRRSRSPQAASAASDWAAHRGTVERRGRPAFHDEVGAVETDARVDFETYWSLKTQPPAPGMRPMTTPV